jgi:hypothetical protein
MRAYPEPNQSFRDFDRKGPVVSPDSHGAVSANLFEVQGGMPKVCLEPFIALVCEILNIARQPFVIFPERGGGKVLQSSFVLPALCSVIAAFASLSSLPAETSSSISLSHSSESYFRNQSLNVASSSRLSRCTSFANSSTLAMILNLRSHYTILSHTRHGANGLLRGGMLFRRPLKQRVGALSQPQRLHRRAVSILALL